MNQEIVDKLSGRHSVISEQYDKAKELGQKVGYMRQELDKLLAKGDTVTQDDVMDAAAKLASHGYDPKNLAAFLADLPEQGAQINGMLQQKEAMVKQQEQKLGQATEVLRDQLGHSAMQSMMMKALLPGSPASEPATSPVQPNNALTSTGASPQASGVTQNA
jgi:hypothetical protein